LGYGGGYKVGVGAAVKTNIVVKNKVKAS